MDSANSFSTAIAWIVGVMLGQAATAIAVIAVAGVGFAMLQGHLAYRDSVRVVLGCAMLFGAPAIARGLMDMVNGTPAPDTVAPVDHPPLEARPGPVTSYDRYAGASLPR